MGTDGACCRGRWRTERSRHDRRGRRAVEHRGDPCLRGRARVAADDPGDWKLRGQRDADQLERPGCSGRHGTGGSKGTIKLNLSGDIGTQLILGRLKALNKKVVDIQERVKDTKNTALYLKGYLNGHHQHAATCKTVESVYHYMQIIQSGPDSGIALLGLGCK